MSSKNVFSSLIFITALVLITFGVLQWLQIPKGTLIDWVIGIAATWWLFIIVTLPWNMHFSAKEVLDEVKVSEAKELKINTSEIAYVQKIAKRYLMIAIALHIISAIVLAILAYLKISPIGYWGAGLALLLMGLRPAIRLQAYIVQRLQLIRNEIFYPREDAYELRVSLEEVKEKLNIQNNQIEQLELSYAQALEKQESQLISLKEKIKAMKLELETAESKNNIEHEKLNRTAEQALAKLSEDTQFLTQIRELIRFVKNA